MERPTATSGSHEETEALTSILWLLLLFEGKKRSSPAAPDENGELTRVALLLLYWEDRNNRNIRWTVHTTPVSFINTRSNTGAPRMYSRRELLCKNITLSYAPYTNTRRTSFYSKGQTQRSSFLLCCVQSMANFLQYRNGKGFLVVSSLPVSRSLAVQLRPPTHTVLVGSSAFSPLRFPSSGLFRKSS